MFKPELLIPVGNTEAFHAAIKGGADAIFLGLRDFNARGRASNFNIHNLLSIVKIAKENNVKVYVTLNIVIKNKELKDLFDVLYQLSQAGVSALIIQDLGVYYIMKNYFPNLVIHASTQMGIHNSVGANFSKKMGIERVVLARELMLSELQQISEKSKIELEVFIHGALCYSFSGMCLFSSYLGGQGANRGLCKQPCRRKYSSDNQSDYIFSLKDNQQIDLIPTLSKMKITSLKVEGRMKSAEYVNTVAKAYRTAIDDFKNIEEAKKILEFDFGREKTSYFLGKDVSEAITTNSNNGVFLSTVSKITDESFEFESTIKLSERNRLIVYDNVGKQLGALKLTEFTQKGSKVVVMGHIPNLTKKSRVFLSAFRQETYSAKLPQSEKRIKTEYSYKRKNSIISQLCKENKKTKELIFVRVDKIEWLRKLRLEDMDKLILNFSQSDWKKFNFKLPFIQKNKSKILVELPKFIAENNIKFYRDLAQKLFSAGFRDFMVSHISQKSILPKGSRFSTNENVYIYNDAAIQYLRDERAFNYTAPQENEIDNLFNSNDRQAIIPMYFIPELFYSRMPVKLENSENSFKDDTNVEFRKIVKDGITITTPLVPVSFLQYKSKLDRLGYTKYLIDLSYTPISKNSIKTLIKRLKNSEQIQPSMSFNFKKGLK